MTDPAAGQPALPVPRTPLGRGTVTTFDAQRGLGTVSSASGVAYPFHATAIADGTRQIAPGTPVVFIVAPGHRGQVEARGLTPA